MKGDLPIAIFDSGVGGLTVMREISRRLPHETILYFGDTARVPYGGKSPETICRYALECSRFLKEHEVKLLVIACNTVSAYALDALKEALDIPVLGVIKAGAAKAILTTRTGHIAVIGTKATIESGAYEREILTYAPTAQVRSIACPLFVPLVEEQFIDHPASALIVNEYLKDIQAASIDTLLLGCTHYPLLAKRIQAEVGARIQLVDSATTCAAEVASVLASERMMAPAGTNPQYRYFVTDDAEKFRRSGELFFGAPLHEVSHVTLSEGVFTAPQFAVNQENGGC